MPPRRRPPARRLLPTAALLAMAERDEPYSNIPDSKFLAAAGQGSVMGSTPAVGTRVTGTSTGPLASPPSATNVYSPPAGSVPDYSGSPVWPQAVTITSLPGTLSILAPQWEYLDPAHPGVPSAPAGQNFIGAWAISPGQTDLTVGLNDATLAAFGQDPAGVKVWAYNGQWVQLDGTTIDGQVATPAGTEFLAIGTPEPGTIAVVGLIGSALLLRRRRRR